MHKTSHTHDEQLQQQYYLKGNDNSIHTVNRVAKTSEFVLVLHKLRLFSFPSFYHPSPQAYLMVLRHSFSSLSITICYDIQGHF
jgi:hypothetical protein